MGGYITTEEGGLLEQEGGGTILQEGTIGVDDGYFGHVWFSIGELIKLMNGEYSLTTPSGKEIKRFKKRPTEKEILSAKQARRNVLGY